jgi:AcrR family transcriptional regulator
MPRPYRSRGRQAGAEATRDRIIKAAMEVLASKGGLSAFTADAVAKKAGVARMTVYYQFGSRRGLLEATFDAQAERRGLLDIARVFEMPDPADGIRETMAVFGRFWGSGPPVMHRLNAAAGLDPEIEASIRSRNERRRVILDTLADRLVAARQLAPDAKRDLVDTLFVLTGAVAYFELAATGRTTDEVIRVLQDTATALLEKAAASAAL